LLVMARRLPTSPPVELMRSSPPFVIVIVGELVAEPLTIMREPSRCTVHPSISMSSDNVINCIM